MVKITPAVLWLHEKMTASAPMGMPVQQVLKLGRLRGFTRRELKEARRLLGVLSVNCGDEYHWRYPFEH